MVENPESTTRQAKKKRDGVAIYARIALDIANRIVNGEIPEGKRLSGRSIMSSEYGVSPETIRRAFSLLEEQHVVEVMQNSGVRVKSKSQALSYITKHTNKYDTKALLAHMKDLLVRREQIDHEMYEIITQIVDSTERFSASNPFYTYECEISQNSSVINRSIGELSFWQKTGATIIAIRRGGSITLSPGPQFIIEANDVLVLVGDQETKDFVNTFIA